MGYLERPAAQRSDQGRRRIKPLEGQQSFTNKLANASSPYLRQHATNPVYWQPWGPEAIEQARAENKPILLSSGYSTCYWCHVMEREVFDNVSIAAQMNEHFVNIKIDREEMPELDELYMAARQLITQQGGWPNNVFLTPDLQPFYAMGTAPASDTGNQPAFPRVLEWIHSLWRTQPDDVRAKAAEITRVMGGILVAEGTPPQQEISLKEQADRLMDFLARMHDDRSGGFFQAPKFPHETYLLFLLSYYEHTAWKPALQIADLTLGKMAAGGINDHVGCGFHRYAVDKEWYVPHFEKMLYNQALIAQSYLQAFRHTHEPYYADMARGILQFCSGPFTHPQGAFYAAFDAEVKGVEGAYYAWEASEIESILTESERAFFTSFYALADIPHFPGHPKPRGQAIIARRPLHLAAREMNMPYVQMIALSGLVMNKLLAVRNGRESPRRDDKIIVAWNGLMIEACADAGRILGEANYTEMAAKAARFIVNHVTDRNGNLQRIWIDGKVEHKARLEDCAYFMRGLLALYRATREEEWKLHALELARFVDERFADAAGGWFTAEADDHLIVRIKNADDNALPAPAAVMLHNLIDLYELTGDERWLLRARKEAQFFAQMMDRILAESGTMLSAFLRLEALDVPALAALPEGVRYASLGAGARKAKCVAAFEPEDPAPGAEATVAVTLIFDEGWHAAGHRPGESFLLPTQIDVRGEGVTQVKEVDYPPEPTYQGWVTIRAKVTLAPHFAPGSVNVVVRFQPCSQGVCLPVADVAVSL